MNSYVDSSACAWPTLAATTLGEEATCIEALEDVLGAVITCWYVEQATCVTKTRVNTMQVIYILIEVIY